MLSIQDGQSKLHKVQLVLYNDALLIQKEEWVNVPLDDEDEVFLNMVRGCLYSQYASIFLHV